MNYSSSAISEAQVPRAGVPLLQHCIDTYASETNKVISVWACFFDGDLEYRPHPRSASVGDIMKHQLLSERRFFGEFLGSPEISADQVVPRELTAERLRNRMLELALPHLTFLTKHDESW